VATRAVARAQLHPHVARMCVKGHEQSVPDTGWHRLNKVGVPVGIVHTLRWRVLPEHLPGRSVEIVAGRSSSLGLGGNLGTLLKERAGRVSAR
jgi:hypothetical protein